MFHHGIVLLFLDLMKVRIVYSNQNYTLHDSGTGSELNLCIEAGKEISSLGKKVRVVSMPCIELFEEQEESYKESVLPSNVKKRVVVEAAHSFGWHKYTGFDGICITMDRFGASAPGGECMKNFGFTVENVVNKTKEIL